MCVYLNYTYQVVVTVKIKILKQWRVSDLWCDKLYYVVWNVRSKFLGYNI